MADALLLASQRVAPQKLQQLGYSFVFPELPAALEVALKVSSMNSGLTSAR